MDLVRIPAMSSSVGEIGRASSRGSEERSRGVWSSGVCSSDLVGAVRSVVLTSPSVNDSPVLDGPGQDSGDVVLRRGDRKSVVEGKRGEIAGCLEFRRVLFRSGGGGQIGRTHVPKCERLTSSRWTWSGFRRCRPPSGRSEERRRGEARRDRGVSGVQACALPIWWGRSDRSYSRPQV